MNGTYTLPHIGMKGNVKREENEGKNDDYETADTASRFALVEKSRDEESEGSRGPKIKKDHHENDGIISFVKSRGLEKYDGDDGEYKS